MMMACLKKGRSEDLPLLSKTKIKSIQLRLKTIQLLRRLYLAFDVLLYTSLTPRYHLG